MTGSTSATRSTAVGAVKLREVATRLGSKNGRKGKMAKLTVSATEPLVRLGMDRSDDGVEGDLRRRRFGRGRCGLRRCERSGLGLLDGVDSGGASGHDERTHGRRGARLRRRHDDGGVGHGGGSARGRSWRGEGVFGGFRGEREADPRRHRARGAARRRAGAWRALWSPSGTCLPGRQAARWSGAGLGRQVGRVLGAT